MPPTWLTRESRAASDTAIRMLTFSSAACRTGAAADKASDRGIAQWKVATTGTSDSRVAIRDVLGAVGSCTCTTSNDPSASHRRTRLADAIPKHKRATDPL